MTSHDGPGFLNRRFAALVSALKRACLGKSDSEYMKRFSGNDEYWDRSIAAGKGWPGEGSRGPASSRQAGWNKERE
jgi:hypothetical protein